MDFSEIGLAGLQIVSPFLVAALTWASAKLAGYIKSKVDNEYLRGLLIRLDDTVTTAVKDLQQTIVEEVKAAHADGKITEAEKRQIKSIALANVKSYLGTKGLKVLASVFGLSSEALDGFLSSKIESSVHDLKVTKKAIEATSKEIAGAPVPLP